MPNQADQKFNDWYSDFSQPVAPPEIGMGERIGSLVATAPVRALNNLSESAANIFGLPDENKGGFLPSEMQQLPQANTGVQQLTNIALGQFLPAGLELAATGRFIPKIPVGPGSDILPQVANKAIQDAVGFGLLGTQDSRQTGLEQTGEGAVLGGLSALPLPARALGAAALGFASKSYFDSQNPTPIGHVGGYGVTQGDVSGALQTLFGIIGGQVKGIPFPETSNTHVVSPDNQLVPYTGQGTPRPFDPSVQPINSRDVNVNPGEFGASGTFYPQATQPTQRPLGLPVPPIEGQFTGYEGFGDFKGNPLPDPITDLHSMQSQEQLQQRVPPELVRGSQFPFRNEPPVIPLSGPIHPEFPTTAPELSLVPTNPVEAQNHSFVQELFHPENAQYLKDKLGIDINQTQAQNAFLQLATALNTREVRMDNRKQAVAFAKFFADLHNRPNNPGVPADAFEQTVQAGQPLHPMQSEEFKRQLMPIDLAPAPFTGNESIPELNTSKAASQFNSPPQGMPEGNPIQRQLNEVRQRLKATQDAYSIGEADADAPFEIESLKRVEAELSKRLNPNIPNAPIDSAVQSAEQVQQARSKSKIPDLPEYRRTEGGNVDPDVLRLLGFGAIRGAAGYALGHKIAANDPSGEYDPVMTGALMAGIAIAGPWGRHLIDFAQKFKQRIHEPGIADSGNRGIPNYRSTIKVGDYDPAMSYGNTVERLTGEAAYKDNAATRQRLADEQTVKGKVQTTPEYKRSEGGFLIPELQPALGRAALGGLIGGTIGGHEQEPGESGGFLKGALLGAGIAMFGPAVGRAALEALTEKKITSPSASGHALRGGFSDFIKNFNSKLEERFGATFVGSNLVNDRLLRMLDKGFQISMPKELKEMLIQSKGTGSFLLSQLDDALLKMSLRFTPNDVVKGVMNDFLDGTTDKAGFLHQMQSHIALDPSNQGYANYGITARTVIDGLQTMVRDGITDPKLRSIISDSIGSYLTRSYKIFNDKRWEPDGLLVRKLANEIHTGNFFGQGVDYHSVETALRQYIREIKTTKGTYAPVNPEGVKINQQVFKERKQLSDAWKQFLGEVTDPVQRINQTVLRLRPMAEAAKFFEKVSDADIGGLPQVFDSMASHDTFAKKIDAALLADPENKQLKFQQANLKSYQPVGTENAFGILAGKMVSRGVWDNLKTFDSSTEITSPFWRAMAKANTAIKLNRTAFNPIGVMRNIFNAGAFAFIGRASPFDLIEAHKIMNNHQHTSYEEILKMGIANVDQIKTEFYKEYQNSLGSQYNFGNLDLSKLGLGSIDFDMAERYARRGMRNWLDVYRAPDNLVRIGSYLSAKRRIAQELGLSLTDELVKQKASEFTNRYTMNYDSIAPAIKLGRNIPFFNLFLSYTAEMGRIGKNLIEDVIGGKGDGLTQHSRTFAAIPLAALTVLPEILQNQAEDDLSPKDKADWDKAKTLMPDYQRPRYKMNIQRQPNGQFTYIDFTPWLPHNDYQEMVKAIANKDWSALAAINPVVGTQNTPGVNILVSQILGKDLHTQKAFRDYGDRFASIAKEVLPPNTPGIGSESIRYDQSHTENAQGSEGTTNMRTGNKLVPSDFWLPYYSALKTGGVNLSVLEKKAQSEAKQEVANEISYANDILQSDAAPAIKQKQLEKTKAALELIREKFAAQLGVSLPQTSTTSNATTSSRQ